ncbi:hypothetical protein CHF27_013740 [Romboutsia maritimum]|uniref:Uncharacterized protein n=1 Tax=Romboutsia maritimum TaxID=2020948 RepID=A0A371IPH8_9FIRM|nr:hypothetical protein [Romboutsia maritimum]RDY22391.1 hypothetical protein CHF27_013740 [Romboutsia maritimum]
MEFKTMEIDNKKLWLRLSGSITYYLKMYDDRLSNEELWEDYKTYAFEVEEGQYHYLDKQTLNYVIVDSEMLEKSKKAFIERLDKRRIKKLEKVSKEESIEPDPFKNNVIDFNKYKKALRSL